MSQSKNNKKKNEKKSQPKEFRLDKCETLLDVLRHMSIRAEQMSNAGMSSMSLVLSEYMNQLVKIHNRQAITMDSFRRAMKKLSKRMEISDTMAHAISTFVEAGVTKPYEFDQANAFDMLVAGIENYKG